MPSAGQAVFACHVETSGHVMQFPFRTPPVTGDFDTDMLLRDHRDS